MIKSYICAALVLGLAAFGTMTVHANSSSPIIAPTPVAAEKVVVEETTAPAPETPQVTAAIKDAKLTEALDKDHPSAMFFTITNAATVPDALVGVTSDACERVELHNHIMEKDIMKMVKVDKIDVPATGSVTLEPMGYHAMCFGSTAKAGTKTTATFTFDVSAPVTITDIEIVPLKKSVKKEAAAQKPKVKTTAPKETAPKKHPRPSDN